MGENTRDPLLQKIWARRKMLRLNQSEMAKKIGISQTAYSAIESGENRMYADYLTRISKVLGLSIGDLFEEDSSKIGPLSEKEKSLILDFRKIPSDEKKAVVLDAAKALGK